MFLFTLLPFLLTFIHVLCLKKKERTASRIATVLLQYLLVVNVGLGGIFAFSGHMFAPDMVAKSIGWPAGSPFQMEVAFVNLAFGILGLLCIRSRGDFWLATGIGYTTFMFGAASVHLKEIALHKNIAAGNAGTVLWIGDILIPLLICSLLALHVHISKKHVH